MSAIENLEPAIQPAAMHPLLGRAWESTGHLRASVAGLIGFAIVLLWVVVALFAPLLERYGSNEIVTKPLPASWSTSNLPGGVYLASERFHRNGRSVPGYYRVNGPPSADAWLGTDDQGRDIYTRLVAGARPVLTLPILAVLIGGGIGILLGLWAGYFGRWADEFAMRLLDTLIAFPTILILLLISSSLGPSRFTVVAALSVGAVIAVARITRGLTLELRQRNYVTAARLRGESSLYVMVREILPNAAGPIVTDLTLRVGYAIFGLATLGFVGLGVPPPAPDWGSMVSDGRDYIISGAPWESLFPAIAIATLVVGLNLLVDGIREQRGKYR
jgi:peptide/nickel transport system permease protein